MSNVKSGPNYFIPVDSYLTEQARQRVIQENGQMVTPAYERGSVNNRSCAPGSVVPVEDASEND